jgi:undecaprenyl-diphosphatase
MNEFLQFFDQLDKAALENYFIHLETPLIRVIANYLSNPYIHLSWFIPSILFYFYKNKLKGLEFLSLLFISLLITSFVIDILKDATLRPRPITYFDIQLAMKYDSFPSGHAGSSFTLASIYSFYMPRFFYFVLIVSILVCLSRILNLKHYPTDIASGAFIGIFSGLICYSIFKKIIPFIRRKSKS